MRNKKWFVLLGIIVLAGIVVWWWRSSASDPVQEDISQSLTPEIEVTSARISSISGDRIDVMAEVILKNPFPVEFSSSSMEYEIYIDSIKVAEDMHDEPVTVDASDSTAIELPIEIISDRLTNILEYFKENDIDSAHYALEASVVLDVPIEGNEEFTMDISDTLPAYKMMEMQVTEVEPNILSSDDGLDLVITVNNFNDYPTEIRDGTFSFTVKDEMGVEGYVEDVIYVPALGTEEVPVHAEKEWGSLTQSALDYLFNQDDTRFILDMNGTMYSDNKMLDESEIDLRVTGTLGEL